MSRPAASRGRAFVLFLIVVVASEVIGGALQWIAIVAGLVQVPFVDWTPLPFVILGVTTFLAVAVMAVVVARIGPRSFRELGFDPRNWPQRLLEGSLWGLAMPTLLVLAIALLGGFTFGSLALHGAALWQYSILWLVAFFGVGIAEEATFRGPALKLLGDAIGFWPAAIVISFIFGLAHYLNKPHENLADVASVSLIGLFLCFTVRRTGSIWWAVGFHALFDYAALFLYGAPNSGNHGGQPLATRLLTGTYHGPAWLTGGLLGIEASLLVFPLLAVASATFSLATMRGTPIEEES